MPSLLRTKIQLPPIRTQHIDRERLMLHLGARAQPDTRLVLVSAPAGFGKSSLLVHWSHGLRRDGSVVAWYAIDERDNDPARFGAYLLGAFRSLGGAFASLPDDTARVGLQEAITAILNAAVELDSPVVLVLDDYQLITEPHVHDAVGFMLEDLPVNMRLAIGTRADPPLQLARLRARGAVTEVRMADLRFRAAETADWLSRSLGRMPSAPLIERLEAVTEGWAAALALLLAGRPEADEQELESQLAGYSRSRRHIFDYLADEVLERQPDEIRQFLFDTCVLDRLHPELCRAMTGREDAPLLLERLAAAGLFVIPLSDSEPTYRYHHLFEQFLRRRLEMEDRRRYLDQHRQAAQWHAAHDGAVEAVQHALAAEALDYAAALIEEQAWADLTSRGETMTLIGWLPAFPRTALRHHPRLSLYFSRALYLTGDIERSREYVQLATEVLDDGGDEALWAIACNYQATLAAYCGEVEAGRRWIQRAAALSDAVDDLDRVRIANTAAFLDYVTGDVAAARRAYRQALEQAQRLGHHYLMLDAHYYLAQADLLAGELTAALERCEAVRAQYAARISPLSVLMLPQAQVHYQRNRPAEAEAALREAITLARQANITDVLWSAHVLLADVLLAQGEAAAAAESIAQARGYGRGYRSPMVASLIGAAEARLMLRSGRTDEAAAWAAEYRRTERPGYQRDYEDLTLAQVLLAQGEHRRARELLARLTAEAEAGGRAASVAGAEAVLALVHQAAGDTGAALAALERALAPARPQGAVRLFLDLGEPMVRLLRRAAGRGIGSGYVERLLDAAGRSDAAQHPADALTEREVEVLRHVAEGRSNQAIATALVVSLGTVKSHIHHIMGKLEARSRTEAVSKARGLGILTD